jgi:hypothetical protein
MVDRAQREWATEVVALAKAQVQATIAHFRDAKKNCT